MRKVIPIVLVTIALGLLGLLVAQLSQRRQTSPALRQAGYSTGEMSAASASVPASAPAVGMDPGSSVPGSGRTQPVPDVDRAVPGSSRSVTSSVAAVAAPSVAASVLGAGIPEDVAAFVAMARNAAIDADERERRILEVGRAGGSGASRKLMALGNEDTYLNDAAIKALAFIQDPAVAEYLVKKLKHGDPRMVAAAAASLARVQGAAAVPSISATLEGNRRRADGQQDVVCAACVEAFKFLRAASALPALAQELEKTVGVSLYYDYGAKVVSAIREIGDPAGVVPLRAYVSRLRDLKTKDAGNPKADYFFDLQIKKVLEAISHLEKQP